MWVSCTQARQGGRVSFKRIRTLFTEDPISADFFDMFVGDHIASGSARNVYCYADGKNVIKFEQAGTYQNTSEWDAWLHVQGTDVAKWFAPCKFLSPTGRVLVQAYAPDMKPHQIPDKVPAFFSDIKYENWGWYKGHPVCRDYGLTLLMEHGMTKRMRKFEL